MSTQAAPSEAKNTGKRTAKVKPLLIKRGNVTVKIYTSQNRVGDKLYPRYSLCYYDAEGKRVRRNFGDLDKAISEAEFQATKLSRGESEALKLTSLDRAVYVQALDMLKPLNVSLTQALTEFVAANTRLPAGTPLTNAVEFFLSRSPAGITKKSVRAVVDEMVRAKENAGKSDVHTKDMASRLGQFADAMQMNIDEVTGQGISAYLDGLQFSARTKNNHLSHVKSLFRWAVKRKYLPNVALEELDAVEAPEDEITDIEIFSPDEVRDMLLATRPEMVAWVAIAAFAGLRNAELQRLDWSDVNLKERHIAISAAKAKTRSRRLVPITDNLFAWLEPIAEKQGRIAEFENMAKQIGWLVEDVNAHRAEIAERAGEKPVQFEWKRNALRHSFISYRLAIVKDVAQVSLEAGNSPNMVFQHYRQLVAESEAQRWFAVQPDGQSKIVPLKAAAA